MANMQRDLHKERVQYAYDKDREQLNYQPYRSTPLITPGPKVKRDTPIVASYLNMHPDPQVRGQAPHIRQVAGLDSMLHSANEQLARKVASQPRAAAGGGRPSDAADAPHSGPKIIHHQFNTPAGLYSSENMASSLQQQTGIAPNVGGPRRDFNLQNSETLRMIMEEDQKKPAVQQKPKSHVVYDVHEAKAVNQPPSMFSNSAKIAQSYSFNKLMWTVGHTRTESSTINTETNTMSSMGSMPEDVQAA